MQCCCLWLYFSTFSGCVFHVHHAHILRVRNDCYAGYLSETQAPELQGLFAALDQECPQEVVPYRELFLQDKDLNQVGLKTNNATLGGICLYHHFGFKPLSCRFTVHWPLHNQFSACYETSPIAASRPDG